MRHLGAADFTPTRWKNGRGQTTQLAVSPAGAGLDDFVWRLSMAAIAEDGPFSSFAGIDRSLVVLAGAGVTLCVGDGAVTLRPGEDAFRFAGDAPVRAVLCDGAVRDFNVMTRRAAATHEIGSVTAGHELSAGAGAGEQTMLFALEPMVLMASEQAVDLGAEELLLLDPAERLKARSGRGLVVSIRPAGR